MVTLERAKQIMFYTSVMIGVVLMFLSIFGIFLSVLDPKGFILYFYTFIFGGMIIAGEFGKLKKYFGFLQFYMGRGFFQIFIGLSIVVFDWNSNVFAKIVGALAIIVGLGHIFVSCMPGEKVEEEELKEESVSGVKVVKEDISEVEVVDVELQSEAPDPEININYNPFEEDSYIDVKVR